MPCGSVGYHKLSQTRNFTSTHNKLWWFRTFKRNNKSKNISVRIFVTTLLYSGGHIFTKCRWLIQVTYVTTLFPHIVKNSHRPEQVTSPHQNNLKLVWIPPVCLFLQNPYFLFFLNAAYVTFVNSFANTVNGWYLFHLKIYKCILDLCLEQRSNHF